MEKSEANKLKVHIPELVLTWVFALPYSILEKSWEEQKAEKTIFKERKEMFAAS